MVNRDVVSYIVRDIYILYNEGYMIEGMRGKGIKYLFLEK